MRSIQWFIFGIGFLFLSGFLFKMTGPACLMEGDLLISCMIRRYAYAIPAIIFHFLTWMFIICGIVEFLNGKKLRAKN
ncbi:hypothetical protein ISS09_04260 [Candidatus Woesearchaeota archaeon]|nr:hypothetical protein [Candidatus Woesearchaeota archaeon]